MWKLNISGALGAGEHLEKFTSINESAESAIKNQSNIATIETLIQQPDLKTGYFGELRTSANKLYIMYLHIFFLFEVLSRSR